MPRSATHLRKEFRLEQWLKKTVDPSMQYVYEVEVGSCRNKRAAESETWLRSRSRIISCITSPLPVAVGCSSLLLSSFLLLSIILGQPLLKLPSQVMDETQVSPSALIMHGDLQWLSSFSNPISLSQPEQYFWIFFSPLNSRIINFFLLARIQYFLQIRLAVKNALDQSFSQLKLIIVRSWLSSIFSLVEKSHFLSPSLLNSVFSVRFRFFRIFC